MRWIWPLLLLPLTGFGQRVVWEKRIGWTDNDVLTDVLALDADVYLTTGTSYFFQNQQSRNVPAVMVMAFTSTGDTLWAKKMSFNATTPHLARGPQGQIYLASMRDEVIETGFRLLTLSPQGDVINSVDVHALDTLYRINRIVTLDDGTILVIGGARNSRTGALDMVVARLEPEFGIVYFVRRFNDHPTTYGNWIEPTSQHTYLASGTAGSRIWALEMDSNGTERRRGTFYTTPSRILFNETACVKQAPGGKYVVSGTTRGSGNNYPFYLGLHQGWAGRKIWGSEQEVEMLPPAVNEDGSIVYYYGTRTGLYLKKVAADSTPVWQVPLLNRLAPGTFPLTLCYNSDSSAIMVGYTNDNNSPLRQDFYLSRITGVGVPYNPGNPVATKPKASQVQPRLYPNPCTNTLRFHPSPTPPPPGRGFLLELYGMEGKVQLKQNVQPREGIDVSGLPRGLYVYRLTTPGRVVSGRVVRE